MATMTEGPHHTPNMPGSGHVQHHHHQQQHHHHHNGHHLQHDDAAMTGAGAGPGASARIVPIPTPTIHTSAPSPGEPMEITTPTSAAPMSLGKRSPELARDEFAKGPLPGGTGPAAEQRGHNPHGGINPNNPPPMPAPSTATSAAAAVSQPKIVQTAFIHKLYSMLEDQSIQHLISWTDNGDSFVMSPSPDFSKVLSQYFKHTNVSSFVRQLNMYGFHKVSDVFHTTSPESSLWEFRHGTSSFRRGDITSLREIKRRASRHALVNREFNGQKPPPSQPGTPAEPMHMAHAAPHDSVEARMASIEHTLYDMGSRLQRSEENAHQVHVRNHALMDSMNRVLGFSHELCRSVLSLAGPDTPVYRDVVVLQTEIQRHTDMIRTVDEYHEPPFSGTRPYFSNIENNPPVSPRQMAQDDPRRSNLAVPQPQRGASNNYYRPPIPSNLSINTRRTYGSIGGGGQASPLRNHPPPPPPPAVHALAASEPPSNLPRRHTSADIRAHWQQSAPSPFAPQPPAQASSQWSPSLNLPPPMPEDQRIRDSFSAYSLQAASQPRSRPTTPTLPPFASSSGPPADFNGWSFGSAMRNDGKGLGLRDMSTPSTRRGSMAHILNPSDTAERDDEDEDPRGDDDRKRKRMA